MPEFRIRQVQQAKFVKPSKHRDLGSDKTENIERKPVLRRPSYSKARPADRGFRSRPATRKFSKGPGKPSGYAPRSGGDFKPRSGGSSDFRRPGGDFKRSGSEGRPAQRTGQLWQVPAGLRRGATTHIPWRRTRRFVSFGAKRTGFGGPPRGGATRRPSGPPRGGSAPRRPRVRPVAVLKKSRIR